MVSKTDLEAGDQPVFPPIVAAYLTKLACELPDTVDRSLSLWTCAELARTLVRDGIVDRISPQTRSASTKPARLGLKPCLLEHEYERKGAWNLFAAFDIQTGEVIAQLHRRKRQVETIALLEAIDKATPRTVETIHLICDNISIHKGKLARQWLEHHPRFTMHHTPVHCSWMNQVEQWFSILRRKRLVAPNFADLDDLAAKIDQFVDEWNDIAHPFQWTASSFSKILDKLEVAMAPPQAA